MCFNFFNKKEKEFSKIVEYRTKLLKIFGEQGSIVYFKEKTYDAYYYIKRSDLACDVSEIPVYRMIDFPATFQAEYDGKMDHKTILNCFDIVDVDEMERLHEEYEKEQAEEYAKVVDKIHCGTYHHVRLKPFDTNYLLVITKIMTSNDKYYISYYTCDANQGNKTPERVEEISRYFFFDYADGDGIKVISELK